MEISLHNRSSLKVDNFKEVEDAIVAISPHQSGRYEYVLLEEANVGFCQVNSVTGGFRVEWMENLALDGPRLPLARAFRLGSDSPDSVHLAAAPTDIDRLSLAEALAIASAFYHRWERPNGWQWVPVLTARKLY